MKVLFVVPRFHTNLFFAVKALCDAGVQVHMICASQSQTEDHSILKPNFFRHDKFAWSAASQLLKSIDPDFVVIRQTGRISKTIFLQCLLQRRPIVGYDQRPYLRRHSALIGAMQDVARLQPPYRFTPVFGLRSRGGRPDARATYLPLPIGVSEYADNRSYAPNGRVRILCVAKLRLRRKNHGVLLEALASLAGQFDFSLTLVGSSDNKLQGYERDFLASAAEQRLLDGRVSVLRNVPFAEMAAIYERHDICVLPSHNEPLGTSPLEAMGHGCVPMISTGCGSACVIEDTDAGVLFPAGDVAALRSALARLLGSTHEVARLGRNAARRASQELGREKFTQRFKNLARSRGALT